MVFYLLQKEIAKDREAHGKKPLKKKDKNEPPSSGGTVDREKEKPSVSNIYFNFFYRLAHTFNPIKILKKREQILMFCMDDMVPTNHMLRLIEKAIDLYCYTHHHLHSNKHISYCTLDISLMLTLPTAYFHFLSHPNFYIQKKGGIHMDKIIVFKPTKIFNIGERKFLYSIEDSRLFEIDDLTA